MAMEGIVSKVGSGVGSTFGGLFSRRFLPVGIGVIIVLTLFFGSIVDSIAQKSLEPIKQDVVPRIILADQSINTGVDEIIEQGGIMKSFFAYLKVLAPLYFIGVIIYGLWWFSAAIITQNTSNIFGNFVIAVLIFFALTYIINIAVLSQSEELTGADTSTLLAESFPFKGTIKLFRNFDLIINPLQNAAETVRPAPEVPIASISMV